MPVVIINSYRLVDNKLSTNVAFPGLLVEHSSDGGKTWCSEEGISLSGKVYFRTRYSVYNR